jgi:hypothetical protein
MGKKEVFYNRSAREAPRDSEERFGINGAPLTEMPFAQGLARQRKSYLQTGLRVRFRYWLLPFIDRCSLTLSAVYSSEHRERL